MEILSPEGEKELRLPNLLVTGHVDGLILLGEPSKAYYRKIAQMEDGGNHGANFDQIKDAYQQFKNPEIVKGGPGA